MAEINAHYSRLGASYLFVEVARRVRAAEAATPDRRIIRLGIGDVTQPLTPAIVRALHEAADEMGDPDRMKGYGPEQGYAFLREAIASGEYAALDRPISPDEIFVSDGSKCDTAGFQELFATAQRVGVPDPVYPVYVDTNIMAGRADHIVHLVGTWENGFVPPPPDERVDLLYLCFPNNPTGAVVTREQLARYVDWAREHDALILFDAAYEAFVRDPAIPRSIYEIPGAETCAVEFRSFSKSAGFTGLRCAWTVVPEGITAADASGRQYNLRDLWLRHQTTTFNGASYPVQRAAAAVYSDDGRRETRALTDAYLENARQIRSTMEAAGFRCTGGIDSPYVWVDVARPSWDAFDLLLAEAGVVTTPGVGFGPAGDGAIRISAFAKREDVVEALDRIGSALGDSR